MQLINEINFRDIVALIKWGERAVLASTKPTLTENIIGG